MKPEKMMNSSIEVLPPPPRNDAEWKAAFDEIDRVLRPRFKRVAHSESDFEDAKSDAIERLAKNGGYPGKNADYAFLEWQRSKGKARAHDAYDENKGAGKTEADEGATPEATRRLVEFVAAGGDVSRRPKVRMYPYTEVKALQEATIEECQKKFKAAFGIEWGPEFAKLVLTSDGKYRDYEKGLKVRKQLQDAFNASLEYVGEERGTPAERDLLRDARANLDGARRSLADAESALTSPEHAEKAPAAERIARFKEAKLEVAAREAHLGEVETALAHNVPLGLGWFVRDKIAPLAKHYFLDGWDADKPIIPPSRAGAAVASEPPSVRDAMKLSGLFKAALQRFVYRFDTKNALGLPPRKDGSARLFTQEELALVWLLAGGEWPEVRKWPVNGLSVAEYLGKTTDSIRKHLDPENPFAPAPSRPRPGKEVRRGPDTSE